VCVREANPAKEKAHRSFLFPKCRQQRIRWLFGSDLGVAVRTLLQVVRFFNVSHDDYNNPLNALMLPL
jgi:hypothetical protein